MPHCQVCGEEMLLKGAAERPTVFCADCSTPHHQDCFEYGGRCAIYGCGGVRFSKEGLSGRDVAEMRVGGERPGQKPKKPARRLILDLVTPLESALMSTTLLLTVGALGTLMAVNDRKHSAAFGMEVPAILFLCTCVSAAVSRSTDCYYVLDETDRQVKYHRRFLGITRLYDVRLFQAIAVVELSERRRWNSGTKSKPGYFYTELKLELVDSRGDRLLVSDLVEARFKSDGAELEHRGRDAAALIGCRFRIERRKYDPWEDTAGPAAMGIPAVFIVTLPLLGAGAFVATACYTFVMWKQIAGFFNTDDGS